MAIWRDELVADIHTELGAKPAVAMLATTNETGVDARCVVVREVHGDGELMIVSDSRSQKNSQLRANPAATAVFWFAKLRRQCRITGKVQILSDKDDDTRWLGAWRGLSDASRALFLWPPPGENRSTNSDDFPKLIPAETPPPANFEVLLLIPESAETLDLNPHPHLRVRWERINSQWQRFPINP